MDTINGAAVSQNRERFLESAEKLTISEKLAALGKQGLLFRDERLMFERETR